MSRIKQQNHLDNFASTVADLCKQLRNLTYLVSKIENSGQADSASIFTANAIAETSERFASELSLRLASISDPDGQS